MQILCRYLSRLLEIYNHVISYPVHVCAAGLCTCLHWFMYVCIYFPSECILLLSILFEPPVHVVCYIQQAVQTQQFMLFQIRHGGPPAPKYFIWHFRFYYSWSCSGTQLVMCFSECFSSCAMIATLLLFIHVCSGISGSASVRLLRLACAVQNNSNCSAVLLQVLVCTGYVFFGNLVTSNTVVECYRLLSCFQQMQIAT